ncbi:MAG: DUF3313 domain-containing protein [Deltaproteobacteria bacterium]|nr:DUF3313 domain-containing protein [Deltaproteobacteria bacterium]
MSNRFLLLAALATAILLVGCSAHKVKSYETSGFLTNYAGFQVGGENQPNLVYINPNLNLKPYNKILIDHVVVYLNPKSKNKGIAPEQLVELTNHFHKALVKALQDRHTIVSGPGKGVLRIRTAITDLEPGSPITGAMSTIIPVGAAISIIKKATTDSNMAVGRASVEIELVDSLSGVRLAAAIDRREGGKKIISGKWTAIEEAFDYWAKNLSAFLDKQKAL